MTDVFRQPERKSSSESSDLCYVSKYYRSTIDALVIDVTGQLIHDDDCYRSTIS